MGFLSLLNCVEGKHRSIDLCPLKDRDVVVLIDNSTRMLKRGRWDEVWYQDQPGCVLGSSVPGERGDGKARHKSLQVQQEGDRHSFPEPTATSGCEPQG